MDNSATSHPKAPGMSENMVKYMDTIGANVSRGGYASAYSAGSTIYETRKMLAEMFVAPNPKNVIFTPGATYSANMVLMGLFKKGDHIITTSMEHNAIARPLFALEKARITHTKILCDSEGKLSPNDILEHITPVTRAIVATHASNVCGTVLPIKEIGQICHEHDLLFIIDAAQTAGVLPISMAECNADAIIMPAHKGLLGPAGLGVLIVSNRLDKCLSPLIYGGTGSLSQSEDMPDFLPDKLEAGTLNIPGIFGLNASLKYIRKTGMDNIRNHEINLAKQFLNGVKQIEGVAIIGIPTEFDRVAAISLSFNDKDNAAVAFSLEQDFSISTRCGLHCAPSAHQTLGTYPHGTIRFSPGFSTTDEDIAYCLSAIEKLSK